MKAPNQSKKPVWQIAKDLGVSRQTIAAWTRDGLTDFSASGVEKFRAEKAKARGGADVKLAAEEWGVSYQTAYYRLKLAPNWKPKPKLALTCPRWMASTHTHAVWHLAEIAKDLKSFPDWGCLWDSEKRKQYDADRHQREWPKVTREERDAKNEKIRAYRSTDEAKAKRRAYKRKMVEANPILKVESALRARLYKFIRGNNKSGIRNLLGCSWLQFRRHLESKFKRGMSWENYGTYWHVDHIIPCKAFDHGSQEQLRQCWHFSNLRPLSAKRNLAKGGKIESPQLSLLISH